MLSDDRILIVDDDERLRDGLSKAFRNRGFECACAKDVEDALGILDRFSPRCAVIDLKMPGSSGLDLIPILKNRIPSISIVVLTGYGSIATAVEAVKIGAKNYLTKPADADQILTALKTALDENPPHFKVPSLFEVEWDHIQRVMFECKGNVTMAAKILGLHRRSLQRKLTKIPQ